MVMKTKLRERKFPNCYFFYKIKIKTWVTGTVDSGPADKGGQLYPRSKLVMFCKLSTQLNITGY